MQDEDPVPVQVGCDTGPASLSASPVPPLLCPIDLVVATPSLGLPARRGADLAKRGFDIVGALLALIVMAPTLLFAAVLVAQESGWRAILFRQTRGGRDGRPFRICKFRTMTVAEDGDEVTQARADDARVTKVGRLLRRTSMDELPQLFNVLTGEMSLVGPRPHALAHDRLYRAEVPRYTERQAVKPGITGWAQIQGHRGPTPTSSAMKERVDLDLWYVANRSLVLDLRILTLTILQILTRRDAI